MVIYKLAPVLLFIIALPAIGKAGLIHFDCRNATVWWHRQTISGYTVNMNETRLKLHVNSSTYFVTANDKRFTVNVVLQKTKNVIWAETVSTTNRSVSDTIYLMLGYTPQPLIIPAARAKGDSIFLSALVKSNPFNSALFYTWQSDARNPALLNITSGKNGEANFVLPKQEGTYFINLVVKTKTTSVQCQTYIKRNKSIRCFNIETDHAAWIDSAVIYEITPSNFTENKTYDAITAKLPELKELGINCIWLQPVFKSHYGHQAYDVIDYFSLRDDIGDEKQLQHLITTAKKLDLKVLFDFVPNHTSIHHAYAQDVIKNNTKSHYYNFYQHEDDGAAYSSLYKKDSFGFYNYFWPELINLDYTNIEVQQWVIEACKYWLKKFDIDGYRFDAMWAVNARNSGFGMKLRTVLKSIKPDILLLAEASAEDKKVFDAGFDAAYDWRNDTTWISHWCWQYDYHATNSLTIFNYPDEGKRTAKLKEALFSGDTTHLRLRFMENNDLPSFLYDHDLSTTKMVAALLFSLPGIPMLYNGQEIGNNVKMYSSKPVFKSTQSILSSDSNNNFDYYQKLIQLRKQYTALRSTNMQSLNVADANTVFALRRWTDGEECIVIMNMSKHEQTATIDVSALNKKNKLLIFSDVLSGENFQTSSKYLNLYLPPNNVKLLLLSE